MSNAILICLRLFQAILQVEHIIFSYLFPEYCPCFVFPMLYEDPTNTSNVDYFV